MTQPELDFEGASWKLAWEFDLGFRHVQVWKDEWGRLWLGGWDLPPRKGRKRLLDADGKRM